MRVRFLGGNVTEWYPQATTVQSLATSPPPAARTREFVIVTGGGALAPGIVELAREGDFVFRGRQLFLQLRHVARRFEVRVGLDDRKQSA